MAFGAALAKAGGEWQKEKSADGGAPFLREHHCNAPLAEWKTRYTLVGLVASKENWTEMRKMQEMLSAVPSRRLGALTRHNGKEFAMHEALTDTIGMPAYFAKPYRSWEGVANEKRNELIRRLFPKGSSFANSGKKQFAIVDRLLNDRPMKLHGWRTPRRERFRFRSVLEEAASLRSSALLHTAVTPTGTYAEYFEGVGP